jgi:hypothetical protein
VGCLPDHRHPRLYVLFPCLSNASQGRSGGLPLGGSGVCGALGALGCIWSAPGLELPPDGRVAQLAERAAENREVTGSTPVPTTVSDGRRRLGQVARRHRAALTTFWTSMLTAASSEGA